MNRFFLDLEPAPPFRLDLTVWALRRRPDNLVDRWDGKTHRRVLVSEKGEPFEMAVMQSGAPESPRLRVAIQSKKPTEEMKRQAASALERMLGLNVELDGFYRMAGRDKKLEPVAERFRGFKPPRLESLFETLVNAIACQQFTLTMGIRLLNSLATKYGLAFQSDDGIHHAFPRPQELANADIEDLRQMKFSYPKARYITGLAQSIVQGDVNLDELAALDDQNAVKRLCDLKGIGRWTAEYLLLRGLGRTRIFPADDVGARNHLQRWLELPEKLNYETVHQALRPWQDYGGLIYFHLLLKSLSEKSILVV
ncbi:MAG: DNA-3-methyladenine glycosylase 2 family protein [Anaerolineales bacterium]|nr:DNA-3-methyladenine glycosylase 2 family protein [Anaerolineales bacterium]